MESTEELARALTDTGCSSETVARICSLYEAGSYGEMLHQMKKMRCVLMADMHESQRRVDRMDFLIHRQQSKMQ
ncbi:MAG: hypothetical protein IJI38_05040 [Clostridia bacterium]|nr:hypothetical protein [Clostridia bacterium]